MLKEQAWESNNYLSSTSIIMYTFKNKHLPQAMKGFRNYILVSFGMFCCLLICGLISYFLFPDFLNLGNLRGILPQTGEEQDANSGGIWNQVPEAQDIQLKANLKNIQTALEQFFMENGFYPENLSTLVDEGYLVNIPITSPTLKYELRDTDYYTLSVTLSTGEEYTLTPY